MKRRFLIRFTCLWLAVLVLLGSSGFTVVEHVCQMRGKVSRVQLTPKGCTTHCTTQKHSRSTKEPNLHKRSCCQITSHYQHLETGQTSSNQIIDFAKIPVEANLPPTFFSLLSALLPGTADQILPAEPDAPLTSSGRDRLVHFCTWLI